MGNEQKQRAMQILRRFEQADPRTRQADSAAVDMAALLQELVTEQPEARTPIQELMAQYAAEGCDFTDIQWARGAAKRLANTMPDSQARCILFALAEQPASVPDWLETTRFLTDVTTAAGLLAHGRRDKGLAQRIGDFAHKYRMLAAAPERDPELVRDAARYRWLQWSNWYVGPDSFYCTEGGDLAEYNDKNVSAENLNAEIDAARAAEKGGRVMGEVAEMMLDGTLCAGCGVYLHGDGEGFLYQRKAASHDKRANHSVGERLPALRLPRRSGKGYQHCGIRWHAQRLCRIGSRSNPRGMREGAKALLMAACMTDGNNTRRQPAETQSAT